MQYSWSTALSKQVQLDKPIITYTGQSSTQNKERKAIYDYHYIDSNKLYSQIAHSNQIVFETFVYDA